MAPNRGSSSKSSSKPSNKSSSSSKSKSKPLASSSRVSKPKSKSSIHRPLPKEVKAKPRTAPENLKKRKKRIYTEKELDLPQLNMITPVGVTKPKGMKKGKVFVDDQESMMTILAIVNAEKEGQIESKMMKARQMEEIREARRKEAEARQMEKKEKLEKVKDSLRKKRRPDSGEGKSDGKNSSSGEAKEFSSSKPSRSKPNRKRVSFT
ncbi:60S ribosomal subunit assembly/export protein LOC1 [Histoplasma capsulatum G186AR]|uniref:60S ribosomal subunit assembly/export protein LOC1 n=1 Tax=Ajellomyces capsulatus TaxID=5037 RepID=A0A8H8CZR5_AJECA|nr:60S ribosomal subunit assembly/export protein LOC1 [Histoplasma capsulatum]QSS74162.1 60S ribosomal subunit assembly/export protein LOC1 [Histoplasma capsulatum G186AR]